MKNDKIKLTREVKAALLKILQRSETSISELHELFPEAIREQALFVYDEEITQINRVLEENR